MYRWGLYVEPVHSQQVALAYDMSIAPDRIWIGPSLLCRLKQIVFGISNLTHAQARF